MALHPLQGPLDRLVDYLGDAQNIYNVLYERNRQRADTRVAQGLSPQAGSPPASNRSLNRAVVVAAVGAWEAFCEDLALTAQRVAADAIPPKQNWYRIDGSGGMVQTPNSNNVGRLFWTLFRLDPVPGWVLDVEVNLTELGGAQHNGWRDKAKRYRGDSAAEFLDAMVKVRHGFAHQDLAAKPKVCAGIVTLTSTGNFAIHSHHAKNSISVVIQLAVATARGLADTLDLPAPFRWSRAMEEAEWGWLLSHTEIASQISDHWAQLPRT